MFSNHFKSNQHETGQKSETSTLKLWFNQGWLLKTGTKNEQISDFANFYYINNATLQHIKLSLIQICKNLQQHPFFLTPMVYLTLEKAKNFEENEGGE